MPACGATITGDNGTNTGRYQVTVRYLDLDPRGQSDQWAVDNSICSSGLPAQTPAYALLIATGTDRATGAFTAVPTRSLQATYTFRTTNQPPPGGLIAAVRGSALAPALCLDAGPAPWTVYGDTDDAAKRYHIVDYNGDCLAPSPTDFHTTGESVGKTVVVPCADADLQMWNAPATVRDPSPLKDVSER